MSYDVKIYPCEKLAGKNVLTEEDLNGIALCRFAVPYPEVEAFDTWVTQWDAMQVIRPDADILDCEKWPSPFDMTVVYWVLMPEDKLPALKLMTGDFEFIDMRSVTQTI